MFHMKHSKEVNTESEVIMKVSDLILINGGWDYDEMLEVYKRVTIETLPKYDVLHKYGDNEILAFRDKMIIIK